MATPLMRLFSVARTALTIGPSLGFLLVLHTATVNFRPDILDTNNRVEDVPVHELSEAYDFIIIGGGSAGAVLANRLTENENWNVLLLEAGPDEMPISDMPILFPALQLTPLDWQFKTEPGEKYCRAMPGGVCNIPRGKVLGGSSVLNAMLYVRGNKEDYNDWEKLGNEGWSYDDVLPYFKKSEDIRIESLANDPYHGKNGYLKVEDYQYHSPLSNVFLESGRELGYATRDINGEFQTGFTLSPGTLDEGLRCSTAKAFLRPANQRPNLHVSLNTMVEKILIDEDKKQAYAVQFTKFEIKRTIFIDREVILSAGSIQTPQLLMISGVGPKNHLEELDIKVIVDSPGVGQNLQDHVAMGGLTFLFNGSNLEGGEKWASFILPNMFTTQIIDDFARNQAGPIYWQPVCEVMAFVHSNFSNSAERPDIQMFLGSFGDNTDGGGFIKRMTGYSDDVYAAMFEPIVYKSAFTIIPQVLKPKSVGQILLKNKNPYQHPRIYPNYFSEERDLDILVQGAQLAIKISQTKAMEDLDVQFNPNRIPGCDQEFLSDDYLRCQAQQYTMTIYHPVGTAKMGPDTDPMAVLTPKLNVRGVKNLRVADASIMPSLIAGNTNAPVIMIAEKAADFIKDDWEIRENNIESPDSYDAIVGQAMPMEKVSAHWRKLDVW